MSFERFADKFFQVTPSSLTGFQIYSGYWKFNFDKLTQAEIEQRIGSDNRPGWCAELLPHFRGARVLELGPGDGYHTAAFERLGADVVAVEGNADAFLRCLILKNALGLKARFELGDLVQALDPARDIDLVYACGVFYHLRDPVGFLDRAARAAKHLYLWTHFYDADHIERIEPERRRFSRRPAIMRDYRGKSYPYYERRYDIEDVSGSGYIGGLNETANWITRADMFAAIDAAGYDVVKMYEEPAQAGELPAVNIFASLR